MTEINLSRSEKGCFYVVMAVALLAGVFLIGRFFDIIVLALVISIITRPLYLRYVGWLGGRKGLGVGLTILTVFVVILIPTWIVVVMTINQATELAADILLWVQNQGTPEGGLLSGINQVLADIPGMSEFEITGTRIAMAVSSLVLSIAGWLAGQVASIAGSVALLIMQVVLFITLLSALLPGWPGLISFLERISPLPSQFDRIFVDRIENATRTMTMAGLISITAQAGTMTFFLWLAGIPYLFFWFLISLFLSALPTGCSLVAFPVGGFLLLSGHTTQGLIIILGYVLVTANVSPVLVPMITGKQTQVNPALTALSLFGGVAVFGFVGVLYGPMIMMLIMTTLGIYLQYVKTGNDAPIQAEGEGDAGGGAV